jgi:hypothetical protein
VTVADDGLTALADGDILDRDLLFPANAVFLKALRLRSKDPR